MSSNRIAVTALMGRHGSISLSASVFLSLCVFRSLSQSLFPLFLLSFHRILPPNQANIPILRQFDIYTKISELGLKYVTVYPVGQLSNQSSSLCNHTATQRLQPAGLYSQPTNQPACLCAFLLLHPCVWLPTCICLSISSSACQSIRMCDVVRLDWMVVQ